MPHFIVERCDADADSIKTTELLEAIHNAAVETGIFDPETVKVRVRSYDEALIAGKAGSFVHVTVFLIDGRDKPTKKRLAADIHETVRQLHPAHTSISVDVRDLDRDIYTKSQL